MAQGTHSELLLSCDFYREIFEKSMDLAEKSNQGSVLGVNNRSGNSSRRSVDFGLGSGVSGSGVVGSRFQESNPETNALQSSALESRLSHSTEGILIFFLRTWNHPIIETFGKSGDFFFCKSQIPPNPAPRNFSNESVIGDCYLEDEIISDEEEDTNHPLRNKIVNSGAPSLYFPENCSI